MDANITLEKLHEVVFQRYEPSTSLAPTPLEQFGSKDFEQGTLATRFHVNTRYTRSGEFQKLPSVSKFLNDPNFQYLQSLDVPNYEGYPVENLPEPDSLDASLSTMLANRRSNRQHTGEGLSRGQLSTLLSHSCGVTETQDIETAPGNSRQSLRAYPSPGALYPVELYCMVISEGSNLNRGLYHYSPGNHHLRVLKGSDSLVDPHKLFAVDNELIDPTSSAVAFFLTGAMWRLLAKYGDRGYRWLLAEAGHLMQNVLLVAEAMDLAAVPLAAYRDDQVNEFIGVNGVDEATLYTACIGLPNTDG